MVFGNHSLTQGSPISFFFKQHFFFLTTFFTYFLEDIFKHFSLTINLMLNFLFLSNMKLITFYMTNH
jgi:hypothetical protein